ncbi:hypothetical protein [Clostridium sp. UBA1056]|uniref:RNA dependent RNA polymerase n=1 Tax=unclassified Clostridium TaxID=2614128 RepID=UPI0032177E87
MKKLKRFITTEVNLKRDGLGNYGFDTKEIVINENPTLMMMFRGLNLNIDEIERIDWMIKVKFENKDEALKLKDLPLTIGDSRYYFYLSTPSDMKNNKAIYVREDVVEIVKQYESIVSCGWLDSLEGKTGVNVNKDVTARLSLFLSSSYHTNIKPNYLVLPEVKYKTIQSIKTFENDKLVVKENYEHYSVFADGCGIASPALMRRVSKELKLGYEPCFIGVRSIKLALKGLLVSVDFIKYFNDMYKGDTDTLRKVNGQLEAKDMWGNWIKIDENTIILNPSMCKWASKISLEKYETSRPEELADIMDSLFITKTSKKEPAKIKRTSYQLLCQLGLNAEDYSEITKDTYDFLSGVLKGDRDCIYKFLGAISEGVEDEEESDSDKELSDKLKYLLTLDFERFYKLPWTRRTLDNMVERSVKELCSGKFFVKGDFKTIVNAPLGILNFVMNRKDVKEHPIQEINDELKANEFWCNTEDKKILNCRFPLSSFNECGIMDFVENDLYKKYCGHWTKELCVFNAKDIRAKTISGADYDTDTIFTTTKDVLINAIIPPEDGLHFISTNLDSIGASTEAYNWNVRTTANVKYYGNIIGDVAITNACISNQAQDLGVYVEGKNITYKNYFKDIIPTDEQKKEFWSWFGQQQRTMNLPREIVKEVIANQFYELEEAIYRTVEASQIAIDAPKTSILPDLGYIKALKKSYKKPYYFKFLPDKEVNEFTLNKVGESVLESYAKWNEFSNDNWKGILARVEYYKNNTSWKNSDIFKELFKVANTFEVNEEEVIEVQKLIEESFNHYSSQRKERDKKYLVTRSEQIEGTDEWYETNEPLLDANGNQVRELLHSDEVRAIMTKTMCFKAERVALEINENYLAEVVCVALFRLMDRKNNNGIQRWIFDFYFKYVEVMCSIEYSEFAVLEKLDSEESISLLFENWKLAKRKLGVTSIGNKELERFETKKDIQPTNTEFKFGCSKDIIVDITDYISLAIDNTNGDLYVILSSEERIGKVYISGANNGVNLYSLVGAKLIIDHYKENDRSYTIWIKGIEV